MATREGLVWKDTSEDYILFFGVHFDPVILLPNTLCIESHCRLTKVGHWRHRFLIVRWQKLQYFFSVFIPVDFLRHDTQWGLFCCFFPLDRQEAILAAISEKDAHIALLELQPNQKPGNVDQVEKLTKEKLKLQQQLKELVSDDVVWLCHVISWCHGMLQCILLWHYHQYDMWCCGAHHVMMSCNLMS